MTPKSPLSPTFDDLGAERGNRSQGDVSVLFPRIFEDLVLQAVKVLSDAHTSLRGLDNGVDITLLRCFRGGAELALVLCHLLLKFLGASTAVENLTRALGA